MKRILVDWHKHPRLVVVILAALLLALAACGGDDAQLPTAVPEAELPEGVDAQIQLPGEETAVEEPEIIDAAPGELAPLPRLENQVPEAGGLGAASSLSEGGIADTAVTLMIANPFSNTTFTLNTDLPGETIEAAVFRHHQTGEVNLEEARNLAARFGFGGELYLENFPEVTALDSEISDFTPPTIYYAFDGRRTFSIDPWSANYHDDAAAYDFGNTIAYAAASQAAEQFLQEKGLLDFPYAIQPGFGSDVFFVRQIDGRVTNQPEIVVGVSEEGQISYVSYQVMQNLENLGSYPLVSAADAWAKMQAEIGQNNIPYSVIPAEGDVVVEGPVPADFQSWQRAYQSGETVQLYGWPNVYLPASGSGPARVHVFPFLLQGDEEVINQIAERVGQQIMVNGAVGDDGRTISVNEWTAVEEQEPVSAQGTVRRNGDQVLFEAQDGQTFILPNVPADVPDGLEAFVFAWSSQETGDAFPLLQWESIDKVMIFEGGNAPADSAAAQPLPVEPGLAPTGFQQVTVDGVSLAYYVTYHYPQAADQTARFAGEPTVLLQPVWKFTGTADSGETIEFFVQAATDEFVQP